jgi:hypothetical protein
MVKNKPKVIVKVILFKKRERANVTRERRAWVSVS